MNNLKNALFICLFLVSIIGKSNLLNNETIVKFDSLSESRDITETDTSLNSVEKQNDISLKESFENAVQKDIFKEKSSSIFSMESIFETKNIIILSLIILSLFLGFIVLFLLKWRKKYSESITTFPENLFELIESSEKSSSTSSENFKKQVEHFNKVLKYIRVTQEENKNSFNEIIESFTKLNNSIIEKENEIKRLRKGFESNETITFIKSIIRLHSNIYNASIDNKNSDETKNELKFIINDLEEKLKEAKVESYLIDSGVLATSPDLFGIPESSNWEIESTDKKEKDNTVLSTIEKGFYLDGEEKTIIKYAKIKVLKFS